MSPVLLLFAPASIKKQLYFVMATLLIILSLPMIAVFALGSSTLSILSLIPGTSSSESEVGLYQGPLFANDTYAWGNCTWWVSHLRAQAGDPIPNTWGNAATWAFYAGIGGYLVDRTPTQGSIMQISDVDGGLGHVAYVESVDSSTGAWTISEMNVKGLDIVDTRTYPASAAIGFEFIHEKTNGLVPTGKLDL